jgi:hypothetical protein
MSYENIWNDWCWWWLQDCSLPCKIQAICVRISYLLHSISKCRPASCPPKPILPYICGITEKSPQQHFEGNTTKTTVITLWEVLTKCQTATFIINSNDELLWWVAVNMTHWLHQLPMEVWIICIQYSSQDSDKPLYKICTLRFCLSHFLKWQEDSVMLLVILQYHLYRIQDGSALHCSNHEACSWS